MRYLKILRAWKDKNSLNNEMKKKQKEVLAEDLNKNMLYVIFKRCNKATGFLRIPQINRKLQLASFPDMEPEEGQQVFKIGDIINTTKFNQILVVYTSENDPTNYFDIEKSSFTPNSIVSRETLDVLDKITISPKNIPGEGDCYVINKRPYSLSDIKDLVKTLDYPESLIEDMESEDGNIIIPTILYNLLGILKEDLFPRLIEED